MPSAKIDVNTVFIGEILSADNTYYSIPYFQRGFSWKKEQVEQFWFDVNDLTEDEYFLGSFVLNTEDRTKIQIIDGQQRLAVITILLAAIRDKLHDLDEYDRSERVHKYVAKTDLRGRQTFGLKLGETDKNFFREYIQLKKGNPDRKTWDDWERIPKRRRKESNKLILSCYNTLSDKVDEDIVGKDREQKIERLTELAEILTQKLVVIQTSVTNDTDAYMLFETLNDRNVELTVSDLLKNFLFSKAERADLDSVKEEWTNLLDKLGQIRVQIFLRHYWMSKIGVTTEKKLYRRLKNHVTSRRINILNFTRELATEAEIYESLINPTVGEFWEDGDTVKHLENLNALGAKQCYPLLLSAKLRLPKENFEELARICEIFTFRYSTICGMNPNELEKLYSKTAIKIRENGLDSYDETKQSIIEECPNDPIFEENFKTKSMTSPKPIRYLLGEIEKKYHTEEFELAPSSRVHIEHIMPKSRNEYWKQCTDDKNIDFEEYVSRIGNLTLLGRKLNIGASNKSFPEKKEEYYSASEFNITRRIVDYEEWDESTIENRQEKLLKDALEIWRLE